MDFLKEFEETQATKQVKEKKHKVKKITEFFNEDYVSYAKYDNIRKIASYIDGLKNSSRKVIFTVLKDNIKNEMKVSNLASRCIEKTNYLHGNTSLEGVIVTLAQNFAGKNNLNLLYPEGNFGSRFLPNASASRYIYTHSESYLRKLFPPEYDEILEEQYFEGDKIEPKFYVPILPLILINGNEGISSGFAQKILPRSIDDIIKAIKALLNEQEIPEIIPSFNGFKGEVQRKDGSISIYGKIERINRTKILITEVPFYSLKKYRSILDDLVEKKVIKSFKDYSDDDNFKFEINVTLEFSKLSDEKIMEKLKLIKKERENFTCIDEDNKIVVFNDEIELLKAYSKVKLEYTEKMKKNELAKIEAEIKRLKETREFVKRVITGQIDIKQSKSELLKVMTDFEEPERLIKLPIYTLNEDKRQELEEKIATLEAEYKALEAKSPKEIWLEEIDEFIKDYKRSKNG